MRIPISLADHFPQGLARHRDRFVHFTPVPKVTTGRPLYDALRRLDARVQPLAGLDYLHDRDGIVCADEPQHLGSLNPKAYKVLDFGRTRA